jgi:Asp-tRNA(Asn)/Glu-tRNA(Gln) amidotransferase B subunit
MYNFGH